MFGSLQEFLPSNINGQKQRKQQGNQENDIREVRGPLRGGKNRKQEVYELKKYDHSEGIQIKYQYRGSNHVRNSRFESEIETYDSLSTNIATLPVKIAPNNVRNCPKAKQFLADDKTFLLNHFKKLKKHYDHGNNDHFNLKNISTNSKISVTEDKLKPTYLHLKGKLKQEHHLLRSLLQVEEKEQVNPKTFFEISFENMSQQFQKIRFDHKLRQQNGSAGNSPKALKFPLYLNEKDVVQRTQSLNPSLHHSQPHGMITANRSPTRTLMIQTRKKWINSRSKVHSLSQQKQRALNSSLENKRNEKNRKVVMNRIDRLLSDSPKLTRRSTSFRGSSLRGTLTRTISKFN